MEVETNYVFQADSKIVNQAYSEFPNYLIQYNNKVKKEYCVLYFASNDLYYPNSEAAFESSIIKKNRFEWFGIRIKNAYKHIFIRDVKKQWYLEGINSELNSYDKLYEFLKIETAGLKLITVGASAGGFAATILGQLLNAESIYSFNGQFEINSLLDKSTPLVDPIIFRKFYNSDFVKYYDSKNFINNPRSIYYFHSKNSNWDIEQLGHVNNIDINIISFITSNHGLPFLKTNAQAVLNLSSAERDKYVGKTMHPLFFSIKLVGFAKTIQGLNSILRFALNKIYISTFQKLKK